MKPGNVVTVTVYKLDITDCDINMRRCNLNRGMPTDPRPPDVIALAAVGATILIHLAIKAISDQPSVAFIAGACVFWVVFVAIRALQDKTVFGDWGFRTENLWPTAAACAALFCIGTAAMGLYATRQGSLTFPLHTLALFLIYPIWGLIQQFLALGIVVGNLERIIALGRRPLLLIVGTAVLFGFIHVYDWRLAAATFVFQLAAVPIYVRFRNLWPIGIAQGWLGALFYLWVLHEDLWMETLGRHSK
jgi:hypothetical protein